MIHFFIFSLISFLSLAITVYGGVSPDGLFYIPLKPNTTSYQATSNIPTLSKTTAPTTKTTSPSQTTQPEPIDKNGLSRIGAPVGFIPIRQSYDQNVFVIDLVIGENDPTLVNSFLLDTTGEYLMIFTPPACTSLSPSITQCINPNSIFTTAFAGGNFFIDSTIFQCTACYIGSDTIRIPWSRDGSKSLLKSGIVDLVAATAFKISGELPNPPLYTIFPLRGIFGLGQPSTTARPATSGDYRRPFADLLALITTGEADYPQSSVQPTSFSYGLDLNLLWINSSSIQQATSFFSNQTSSSFTSESRLYLSGIPPQYRDSMIWSIPAASDTTTGVIPSRPISYPLFTAYSVSVCNVLLYSSLAVIVDTMSPCLGVPIPMFDAMMSWLPMECDFALTEDGNRQCWYTSTNLEIPSLPTLYFSLSSSSSSSTQPATLHLPLDHLLFPVNTPIVDGVPYVSQNQTNHQRMCIMTSPDRSYMSLGSIPLSAFYYHRDFDTNSNGFANKLTTTPSFNQCLPRLQCIGQESSYPAYNFCYPPLCGFYWFFQYDAETRACVLSISFPIILAFAIAIFVIAEGLFYYFEQKLDYDITHEMPKMTLVQRSESRRYRNSAQQNAPTAGGVALATQPQPDALDDIQHPPSDDENNPS